MKIFNFFNCFSFFYCLFGVFFFEVLGAEISKTALYSIYNSNSNKNISVNEEKIVDRKSFFLPIYGLGGQSFDEKRFLRNCVEMDEEVKKFSTIYSNYWKNYFLGSPFLFLKEFELVEFFMRSQHYRSLMGAPWNIALNELFFKNNVSFSLSLENEKLLSEMRGFLIGNYTKNIDSSWRLKFSYYW